MAAEGVDARERLTGVEFVPGGARLRDGPSAGLALLAAGVLSMMSGGHIAKILRSAAGDSAGEKAFGLARGREHRLAAGLAFVAVGCAVAAVVIGLLG